MSKELYTALNLLSGESKQVGFRLPINLLAALDERLEREGLDRSEVVRTLCLLYAMGVIDIEHAETTVPRSRGRTKST